MQNPIHSQASSGDELTSAGFLLTFALPVLLFLFNSAVYLQVYLLVCWEIACTNAVVAYWSVMALSGDKAQAKLKLARLPVWRVQYKSALQKSHLKVKLWWAKYHSRLLQKLCGWPIGRIFEQRFTSGCFAASLPGTGESCFSCLPMDGFFYHFYISGSRSSDFDILVSACMYLLAPDWVNDNESLCRTWPNNVLSSHPSLCMLNVTIVLG